MNAWARRLTRKVRRAFRLPALPTVVVMATSLFVLVLPCRFSLPWIYPLLYPSFSDSINIPLQLGLAFGLGVFCSAWWSFRSAGIRDTDGPNFYAALAIAVSLLAMLPPFLLPKKLAWEMDGHTIGTTARAVFASGAPLDNEQPYLRGKVCIIHEWGERDGATGEQGTIKYDIVGGLGGLLAASPHEVETIVAIRKRMHSLGQWSGGVEVFYEAADIVIYDVTQQRCVGNKHESAAVPDPLYWEGVGDRYIHLDSEIIGKYLGGLPRL